MNEYLLRLVGMLPASWQPKVKGIIGFIGLVVTAIVAFAPTGLPSWFTVVVAALTWLGVYGAPAVGYAAPERATTS
jgi:uncharacterized membrane protein